MVRHNRQPFAFWINLFGCVMCVFFFPHFSFFSSKWLFLCSSQPHGSLSIGVLLFLMRCLAPRRASVCVWVRARAPLFLVCGAHSLVDVVSANDSVAVIAIIGFFVCCAHSLSLYRWRRRLKVCGGRRGIPRKKPPNDDDVAGKKCTTLAVVTVVLCWYIYI